MLVLVSTVGIVIIVIVLYHHKLYSVFGHFSHRSEWQLVKVDYKSIFDRRCAEEDYRPWQLHSQVGGKKLVLTSGWEARGLEWETIINRKKWGTISENVHIVLLYMFCLL